MFGIGHLLKKIQNRQTREYFVKEIVRASLKETVGVDVIVENIKIKESVVYILNVNQMIRSEIYIKKYKTLKLINERQNTVNITDLK